MAYPDYTRDPRTCSHDRIDQRQYRDTTRHICLDCGAQVIYEMHSDDPEWIQITYNPNETSTRLQAQCGHKWLRGVQSGGVAIYRCSECAFPLAVTCPVKPSPDVWKQFLQARKDMKDALSGCVKGYKESLNADKSWMRRKYATLSESQPENNVLSLINAASNAVEKLSRLDLTSGMLYNRIQEIQIDLNKAVTAANEEMKGLPDALQSLVGLAGNISNHMAAWSTIPSGVEKAKLLSQLVNQLVKDDIERKRLLKEQEDALHAENTRVFVEPPPWSATFSDSADALRYVRKGMLEALDEKRPISRREVHRWWHSLGPYDVVPAPSFNPQPVPKPVPTEVDDGNTMFSNVLKVHRYHVGTPVFVRMPDESVKKDKVASVDIRVTGRPMPKGVFEEVDVRYTFAGNGKDHIPHARVFLTAEEAFGGK